MKYKKVTCEAEMVSYKRTVEYVVGCDTYINLQCYVQHQEGCAALQFVRPLVIDDSGAVIEGQSIYLGKEGVLQLYEMLSKHLPQCLEKE